MFWVVLLLLVDLFAVFVLLFWAAASQHDLADHSGSWRVCHQAKGCLLVVGLLLCWIALLF